MLAESLPDQKHEYVKKLQAQGRVVAMIGECGDEQPEIKMEPLMAQTYQNSLPRLLPVLVSLCKFYSVMPETMFSKLIKNFFGVMPNLRRNAAIKWLVFV